MTAGEFNQMPEAEVRQLIDDIVFEEYHLAIENKNSRLILRSIDKLSDEGLVQTVNANLSMIRLLKQSKKCALYF